MLPKAHPVIVRLCHWAMALAVLLLVMSGWRIYNATPFFGFVFPSGLTLGGWLGGALQWHFAAIWLLGLGLVPYVLYGLLSVRFARKFWPIAAREVVKEVDEALRFKLVHDDLNVYNHTQRLAYAVVVVALCVVVASGLVLWKPVQFPILRTLLGDYEVARRVHFLAMAVIAGFALVHIALVIAVPRTLSAMVGIFGVKK
jgi:thiosulfate reductase cytochrome b subunit